MYFCHMKQSYTNVCVTHIIELFASDNISIVNDKKKLSDRTLKWYNVQIWDHELLETLRQVKWNLRFIGIINIIQAKNSTREHRFVDVV